MDQYNPFENSNHKVSKNPFEKKNKSSDMFEPTSNNHLETWDSYKKSEKQVKKYTKQNTINSSSINKIPDSINKIPKLTINKPVINTQNKTKGGIIALIVCVVFSMMSFIDSTFEEDDDYTFDDPNEYVYELMEYDKMCIDALEGIKNNSYSNLDISEIHKKSVENNINIDEMIDDINGSGVYGISGDNYNNIDSDHKLVYRDIYDYDEDEEIDHHYAVVFLIEGKNINDFADDFNSDSKGNIIGIELVLSDDYDFENIKDTVKCGNCEYEGKSLDKYLQEEFSY